VATDHVFRGISFERAATAEWWAITVRSSNVNLSALRSYPNVPNTVVIISISFVSHAIIERD
jgi:hypothetical protein